MPGVSIDQISLGDFYEFSKTISESDIYLYAGISGDFNPAHINQEYAKKTFFLKQESPMDFYLPV